MSSEHSSASADADDAPQHDNHDDATPPEGQHRNDGCCLSQQLYIESGNNKKVLYLLSIGVQDSNNEPLFSFEREPWSLVPKTSIMRPRNTDYVNEIVRRANLFEIVPVPRPSNWTRLQTSEWLHRNPVRDEKDIEFLTMEVLRLRNVLERRTEEQQQVLTNAPAGGVQRGTSSGGRGHWRGSVPYLRIIMCLTQDNVKCLFLTRANSRSRQQLDARNCDNRPPTVFEVIAELWNNPSFNPVAPPSECHLDFQLATDCSYDLVSGLVPATPQKVEDCFTSMRSELLRIITRWEQSGQGEGGRDQEEEGDTGTGADQEEVNSEVESLTDDDLSPTSHSSTTIGSLKSRPPRALQSRAAFLNGAADASMAPSVTSTSSGGSRSQRGRHRRAGLQEGDQQEHQRLFTPLIESVRDLAECQRQMRIDRERDRTHERELEAKRLRSEQEEQSRKRLFQRRTELLDLARQYRRMNAELDMSDERSKRLSEFYVNEGRLLEEELRLLGEEDSNDTTS